MSTIATSWVAMSLPLDLCKRPPAINAKAGATQVPFEPLPVRLSMTQVGIFSTLTTMARIYTSLESVHQNRFWTIEGITATRRSSGKVSFQRTKPFTLPLPPFPELNPPMSRRELTRKEREAYVSSEDDTFNLPPSTMVCIGEVTAPLICSSSGAPSAAVPPTGSRDPFVYVSLEVENRTPEQMGPRRDTFGDLFAVHVVYEGQRFAILEQSRCDIAVYLASKAVALHVTSPVNDDNKVYHTMLKNMCFRLIYMYFHSFRTRLYTSNCMRANGVFLTSASP